MSLAPLYDKPAKQGDDFLLGLVYLEDDEITPIDVTGVKVEFSLAPARGGKPSFTYTEDDYVTVGTTDGVITIDVPAEETKKWVQPRLFYEITLTFPDTTVLSILEGRILIRREVVV
jgi:hypothetical protein